LFQLNVFFFLILVYATQNYLVVTYFVYNNNFLLFFLSWRWRHHIFFCVAEIAKFFFNYWNILNLSNFFLQSVESYSVGKGNQEFFRVFSDFLKFNTFFKNFYETFLRLNNRIFVTFYWEYISRQLILTVFIKVF
jgi:hypothetical protein